MDSRNLVLDNCEPVLVAMNVVKYLDRGALRHVIYVYGIRMETGAQTKRIVGQMLGLMILARSQLVRQECMFDVAKAYMESLSLPQRRAGRGGTQRRNPRRRGGSRTRSITRKQHQAQSYMLQIFFAVTLFRITSCEAFTSFSAAVPFEPRPDTMLERAKERFYLLFQTKNQTLNDIRRIVDDLNHRISTSFIRKNGTIHSSPTFEMTKMCQRIVQGANKLGLLDPPPAPQARFSTMPLQVSLVPMAESVSSKREQKTDELYDLCRDSLILPSFELKNIHHNPTVVFHVSRSRSYVDILEEFDNLSQLLDKLPKGYQDAVEIANQIKLLKTMADLIRPMVKTFNQEAPVFQRVIETTLFIEEYYATFLEFKDHSVDPDEIMAWRRKLKINAEIMQMKKLTTQQDQEWYSINMQYYLTWPTGSLIGTGYSVGDVGHNLLDVAKGWISKICMMFRDPLMSVFAIMLFILFYRGRLSQQKLETELAKLRANNLPPRQIEAAADVARLAIRNGEIGNAVALQNGEPGDVVVIQGPRSPQHSRNLSQNRPSRQRKQTTIKPMKSYSKTNQRRQIK